MYNYLNYGIEGVHYRVVDGKYVHFLEDAEERRETEVRPLVSLMGIENRTLVPEGDPLRTKSEALTADNLRILAENPAEGVVSETLAERSDELNAIIRDATYRFIPGMTDEDGFRREIDRWMSSGGEKVIEEINAAVLKVDAPPS